MYAPSPSRSLNAGPARKCSWRKWSVVKSYGVFNLVGRRVSVNVELGVVDSDYGVEEAVIQRCCKK